MPKHERPEAQVDFPEGSPAHWPVSFGVPLAFRAPDVVRSPPEGGGGLYLLSRALPSDSQLWNKKAHLLGLSPLKENHLHQIRAAEHQSPNPRDAYFAFYNHLRLTNDRHRSSRVVRGLT
jgi:hypothetical protein